MFQKLFLIVLLSLSLSANQNSITHFLHPKESQKSLNAILSSISNAQESIYVMIFNFTHKQIAKALKDAAKRGVKVNIITDLKQSKNEFSQIAYLNKYNNILIYTLEGKKNKKEHTGSMHLKIIIIDDTLTFTGSANFSQSAFTINYENIILFNDPKTAKIYKDYFYEIKKRATTF